MNAPSTDQFYWSDVSLRSRIVDESKQLRRAAGCPQPEEIEAYSRGLRGMGPIATAVVLGMTPEVRRLALRVADRVMAVDRSEAVIQLYRSWVPEADACRETIVRGDWFDFASEQERAIDVILGDGIFSMLPDVEAHGSLLRVLRRALRSGGRLVVRKIVVPSGFDPGNYACDRLLQRFRAGEMDREEFGFTLRFLGFYQEHYDKERSTLDNRGIFSSCDRAVEEGVLTRDEAQCVRGFFYDGPSCLVHQETWEALLLEAGFRFEIQPLQGKLWHKCYKVYACTPTRV